MMCEIIYEGKIQPEELEFARCGNSVQLYVRHIARVIEVG